MKFFISVDMEGISGVVNISHVTNKGWHYEQARKWMTQEVVVVAEKLRELGAERIVVADAHGMMTNLILDQLPEYVELISGFPRPASMVYGIWEGFDAALFLGYHAKALNARGVLSHTFFREYRRITINGKPASEFLINAYLAGENGVPVILISGDSETCLEARTEVPEIETVVTKVGINRWSAWLKNPHRVKKELQDAVEKAVKKLKDGKFKPLRAETPIKLEIEFSYPEFADIAELVPGAVRLSDVEVRFEFETLKKAYEVLELIVMAGLGMRYIASSMTR